MIPQLHYISQGVTTQDHLDNIQKACGAGTELVQLRLKNVSEQQALEAAEKARIITSHYQTRLIINDYYKIAKEVKADGVHLGQSDTCPTIARKHLYSWQIIGGTANTLEDCERLITKKVDYIGLGPYRFTATKHNLSPVLGLKGYESILDVLATDIPILAIGGITTKDVVSILSTGVHGIAISGEITRDFNTISRFKRLINGGTSTEQVWNPKDIKK
ncbi:MAG: thiamine phosphate synthase [Flavobacteriaceae bacterium]